MEVSGEEPGHHTWPTSHEGPAAWRLREQLTKLQALVGLSMVMTDSADARQIARLAASSVSSLAAVRCDGVHVANRGWLETSGSCQRRAVRLAVEKQLRALHGQAGSLRVEGEPWAWAIPMRSFEGNFGHVVIAGERPVSESDQFLLRVLTQQLGIAIANADSHGRERATAEELRKVNLRLERNLAIHSQLTQAAVQGRGLDGIAEIVHELTGYPVVIDNERGSRLASAGPVADLLEDTAGDRAAGLREVARHHPSPARLGDRLAAASGQAGEIFAVLALVDPSGTAGEEERMALEYGATVLALEMSRLASVVEAESRMRGDLLEELLSGIEDERVRTRASFLGYDLDEQQRVAIVAYPSWLSPDRAFEVVRRALQDLGLRPLLTARRDTVVALTGASTSWTPIAALVHAELGREGCRVGVGGVCQQTADVPRSYREAQLALRVMSSGGRVPPVVSFDELGVFQILAEAQDPSTVGRFVRTWLGALLDYDNTRGAQLVPTLAAYLETGCNYARSASLLHVHRNTLRYRLRRIGEISGYDIGEPDVQFNLQLATRAWRTSAAIQLVDG